MPDSTTIAGIAVPSSHPLFLAVVAVHVGAGLTCVATGAVAMLSPKGRGRHSRAGLLYYRALIVVVGTMSALALARWSEDAHLFVLGWASFTAAFLARRSILGGGRRRVRLHLSGMGASYILLLVAFYVDNGKQLPVWKQLPHFLYWFLPVAIGVPLVLRSVMTNPLARAEHRRDELLTSN